MDRPWLRWTPFALLGGVLLAWLWPLLAGETLFWGLPTLQFYPWRAYAFDQLRAGQLPLWNPYNGGGAPLLANYQTAVFYPPNWLHLVLPHVTAMNLLAVGHVIWAAVGMWFFAGAWKLPPLGRGIGMLAYGLGGYLVARLGSFPTAAATAWFPWMMWACHRVVMEKQASSVAWLALATGLLLLAGHAQTAFYVLLASGAYVLWLSGTHHGWRARFRVWAWAAGAVALGVGLAAIQLVPTAQLLAVSDRASGLDYDWTTNFSYSIARAMTLAAPNIYGTPADGSYVTEGAYFEDAAYIGLLPLVAALFAVIGWVRARRGKQPDAPAALRGVPFWVGMAIVAFLIALGKNGPVFPLLYRFVPTFKDFQGPVRWLILSVFGLSILAGIGVSHAWNKGRWTIFWSRLIAAGGLGMAAVAALVAPRLLPDDIPALQAMVSGFVSLGLWLSGCAILTLLMPEAGGRWRSVWQVLVLVFVAADLFWASRGLNPTVPAEFFEPRPASQTDELLYLPEAYEERLKFETYFLMDDYRVAAARWRDLRDSLLPNLNMIDGVRLFNNFDPIVTERYAHAVGELEARFSEADRVVVLEDVPVDVSEEPFGADAVAVGAGISLVALLLWGGLWVGRLARSRASDKRV